METTEENPNGVLVHLHLNGWTVTKPNEHYPDGKIKGSGTISGYGDGWKKYIRPGTPIVDTKTIPWETRFKWAMQSPSVNPDLKGLRGAKVERDPAGISEEDLDFYTAGAHPSMRAVAVLGNLSYVSVEEWCNLAKEWGATVRTHGYDEFRERILKASTERELIELEREIYSTALSDDCKKDLSEYMRARVGNL